MKQKILTLTIMLLVLTNNLVEQNLNGIWVSSYSMGTNKSVSRTDTILILLFFS